MKAYNPSILDASDIFFHTGSALAKRLYFYLLCCGHYYCDRNYSVNRKSYDSFLALYVKAGSGTLELNGKSIPLKAGALALIDCYQPHQYSTRTGWEIYWVHFDGVMARQYYDFITENGVVFSPQNPYSVERSLRKIITSFHENIKLNEVVISKQITDLLTELTLCSSTTTAQEASASIIEDTLAYISKNANKPLPLDLLAKRVSLSPFYFTRVFKKETGFTPHEYIIHVRVDLARFMLKTTDATIKEIAAHCGFNSECSFCTTFKKSVGVTPTTYRERVE